MESVACRKKERKEKSERGGGDNDRGIEMVGLLRNVMEAGKR